MTVIRGLGSRPPGAPGICTCDSYTRLGIPAYHRVQAWRAPSCPGVGGAIVSRRGGHHRVQAWGAPSCPGVGGAIVSRRGGHHRVQAWGAPSCPGVGGTIVSRRGGRHRVQAWRAPSCPGVEGTIVSRRGGRHRVQAWGAPSCPGVEVLNPDFWKLDSVKMHAFCCWLVTPDFLGTITAHEISAGGH
jgi:hypothetical protein